MCNMTVLQDEVTVNKAQILPYLVYHERKTHAVPLFFHREAVHMVTSLDISNGKYSMRDIVLPTPGTATILLRNKVADRYVLLLLKKVSMLCFTLKVKFTSVGCGTLS